MNYCPTLPPTALQGRGDAQWQSAIPSKKGALRRPILIKDRHNSCAPEFLINCSLSQADYLLCYIKEDIAGMLGNGKRRRKEKEWFLAQICVEEYFPFLEECFLNTSIINHLRSLISRQTPKS